MLTYAVVCCCTFPAQCVYREHEYDSMRFNATHTGTFWRKDPGKVRHFCAEPQVYTAALKASVPTVVPWIYT